MRNRLIKKIIFIILATALMIFLQNSTSNASEQYTFHFDNVVYKYSKVNDILNVINECRSEANVANAVLDPTLMQIAKQRATDFITYLNDIERPDGTKVRNANSKTEITQYKWYASNFYNIDLNNLNLNNAEYRKRFDIVTKLEPLLPFVTSDEKNLGGIITNSNYDKGLATLEGYNYVGISIVQVNNLLYEYVIFANGTIENDFSIPTSDVSEDLILSIDKNKAKPSLYSYRNTSGDVKNVVEGAQEKLDVYVQNGNTDTFTQITNEEDIKQFSFISSDSSSAKVSDTGVIDFISPTTSNGVTIYLGNTKIKYIVSENKPITEIKISESSIDMRTDGNIKSIYVTITPKETTDDTTITWKISDENIASLSYENGTINYITPISGGKAVITATTSTGLEATCEVNVIDIPIEKIIMDKEVWVKYRPFSEYQTLTDEEKEQYCTFRPKIYPEDTTHNNIKYEVLDEEGYEKYGWDDEMDGGMQKLYIYDDGSFITFCGTGDQKVKVYSADDPNVYTYFIVHVVDEIPQYRLGDVNADGKINVIDCTAILKHIKGTKLLTDDEKTRADVNKDNKVNVIDCTAILKHIKGTKLIEE